MYKEKLDKVIYSDYDISQEILMIYEQSDDGIENMEILKLIIDFQFKDTFQFVRY